MVLGGGGGGGGGGGPPRGRGGGGGEEQRLLQEQVGAEGAWQTLPLQEDQERDEELVPLLLEAQEHLEAEEPTQEFKNFHNDIIWNVQ